VNLKLIYIQGFARSGTTILGNLLGELGGFIHVGELYRLWRRAAYSRDRCGCGMDLEVCPLWSRAIETAFSGSSGNGTVRSFSLPGLVKHAWEVQQRAEGGSQLGNLLHPGSRESALSDYARLMEGLLHGVAEVSGSRVIVDSSKLIGPDSYLTHMRTVTPYYLHVVRDARGAVYSRQRRYAPTRGEKAILNTVTTIADCVHWSRSNWKAGARRDDDRRQMILTYESFISRPATALEAIAKWVGESPGQLPLIDQDTARLGTNHTVSGNRNRFETGDVKLRLDERWKSSLRLRDFLLITALTAPFLSKYGYSLKRG
jgi:hypothetical protein